MRKDIMMRAISRELKQQPMKTEGQANLAPTEVAICAAIEADIKDLNSEVTNTEHKLRSMLKLTRKVRTHLSNLMTSRRSAPLLALETGDTAIAKVVLAAQRQTRAKTRPSALRRRLKTR